MNNGIFVQNLLDKPSSDNSLPRTLSGSNTVSLPYNYAGNDDWRIDKNSIVLVFDTRYEADTSVTLRVGGYNNIIVDWGDGKKFNYSGSSNITYQYSNHGIYVVQINGIINSLGSAILANRNTLIKCLSLGNTVTSLRWAFGGSSALGNINLTTVPNQIPTTCTSLNSCFIGCTRFNDSQVNNWNTSNISDMSSVFNGCASFNQSIGSWNTSNVTDLSFAFQSTPFNQPIGNWDVSNVTNFDSMFFSSSSNGPFNQDLSSWNINSSGEASINMSFMFRGCPQFNNASSSGINNWNTSRVTNTSSMFLGCSAFNQPLNNWNVQKVTSFESMFQSATSFNSSLSGWALGADVSGVNCRDMFLEASAFTGSGLESWNTNKVTNMQGMLRQSSMNTDISTWDVSNVTNMQGMFLGTPFNQNISSWDTSKVTTFVQMFQSSPVFNQPIGSWNTSSVTSLNNFLLFNGAFNQSLGGWDTSKVTGMNQAFYSCPAFVGSGLENWNTSSCTTMSQTFWGDRDFSVNLSGWDVSKVTTMFEMFRSCVNFNGNGLESWNLAGLNTAASLDNFAILCTFPSGQYDAILVDWNNNKLVGANGVANWRTDLRPHFGSSKYTAGGAAATARAALVSYGWTITDGGTA